VRLELASDRAVSAQPSKEEAMKYMLLIQYRDAPTPRDPDGYVRS
jgi:hypothetical protein